MKEELLKTKTRYQMVNHQLKEKDRFIDDLIKSTMTMNNSFLNNEIYMDS